jgi:hypothetical protein
MAQVITRCQLTGHYVFMGIDIEAEQFAGLPDTLARKFCPFCCCQHDWYKKNSKLLDRRPSVRQNVQQAL